MKRIPWRIKDIIDLEFLLHRDERMAARGGEKPLCLRDREIYLKRVAPLEGEACLLTPSVAVRAWLDQRRAMDKKERGAPRVLPGEAFEEGYRLACLGLLVAGILSGSGLAFSFLIYRGTEPLNVASYLALFVLTQCLMLLVFTGISVLRRAWRSPFGSSVLYSLIGRLMAALIVNISDRALRTAAGAKRGKFEALSGLLRGKRDVYGSLFYWPVFILAQVFGVGFNLGVLGTTLLKVLGSDVAFGWQSTVQFSAHTVFNLVKTLALPWSWLIPPDVAHPTLQQVEGSHLVLKEGIYHLATGDLVSWWPFLCFAVITYGLLPRLILLAAGFLLQKKALSRIDFGHRACERLLFRMRTPLVTTQAPSGDRAPVRKDVPGQAGTGETGPREGGAERTMTVLVPDDIYDSISSDELDGKVSRVLGYPVSRRMRIGMDDEEDRPTFQRLSRMGDDDKDMALLLVQEAWQPPIRENLRFIRDLRTTLGGKSMIWVGLIGRPGKGSVFTRVKDEDWSAWNQKIEALGDPYLGLVRLEGGGD